MLGSQRNRQDKSYFFDGTDEDIASQLSFVAITSPVPVRREVEGDDLMSSHRDFGLSPPRQYGFSPQKDYKRRDFAMSPKMMKESTDSKSRYVVIVVNVSCFVHFSLLIKITSDDNNIIKPYHNTHTKITISHKNNYISP
jgi:hypothetical protein